MTISHAVPVLEKCSQWPVIFRFLPLLPFHILLALLFLTHLIHGIGFRDGGGEAWVLGKGGINLQVSQSLAADVQVETWNGPAVPRCQVKHLTWRQPEYGRRGWARSFLQHEAESPLVQSAQPARPLGWGQAFWFHPECTSLRVVFNYVFYLNLIQAGSQPITFLKFQSIKIGADLGFKMSLFFFSTDITNFISKLDFLSAPVYCRNSQIFLVHGTLVITVDFHGVSRPKETPDSSVY